MSHHPNVGWCECRNVKEEVTRGTDIVRRLAWNKWMETLDLRERMRWIGVCVEEDILGR